MSEPNSFAAELLEVSAAGYAALAAERLVTTHPELAARFSTDATGAWRGVFAQRIVELATALRLSEPDLFVARVNWARRAFTARDVPEADLRASLDVLAEVLARELPDEARPAAAGMLALAIAEFDHPAEHHGTCVDPGTETGRLALEYLSTVLEGDSRRATERLLEAADGGLGVERIYLEVLVPAQQEIGRLWHAGELGIVEEHVVTHTTERLLALLAHRATRAPANGRTVLCAAVAGNTHDIAVRVLADFFDIAGWRSIHLGGNLPATELATAVQYFDGELVVLSAALSVQLPRVAEAIAAVRRLEGREVRVMVGGLAFADAPDVWRKLGADGYAPDARSAVELGTGLLEA